jgi:hypothetical protein
MDEQVKVFRVFIASPNDCADERRSLREEVEEINGIFSRETDLRIELLGWEDTLPGAGRPQELINVDLDKADLFIGCLWRRWGTPTGADGRTGFEEEFERALTRRTKTGVPEMWLFFKDVDAADREDPGEQLKRVLAFRAQEVAAKRLLFNEFADTPIWRQKISTLLHRHLLKLFRTSSAERTQLPGPRHTSAPAPIKATSKGPPQQDVARTSIAAILTKAGEELQSKGLIDFRQSLETARCVRLLVFAASLYSEKEQPTELGVHEINSVFLHRSRLQLTAQERLYVIKTILTDASTVKPGWYWSARWKLKIARWLPWLILNDRDSAVRALAINFARNIGFSLHRRTSTGKTVIARAIDDAEPRAQIAALDYLGSAGRKSDLTALNRISREQSSPVRVRAAKAASLLRLRLSPDKEARRVLVNVKALDPETVRAVSKRLSDVTIDTLRLCLTSQDAQLRAATAQALRLRNSLHLEIALQLCTDQARTVRAQGFLELIKRRAAPKPDEIRRELRGGFSLTSGFETSPVNADDVIREYFNYSTQDELWSYVNEFNENSGLALRALGSRFFDANGGIIRDLLANDFASQVEAAKERRRGEPFPTLSFSILADPIEGHRRELRTAALDVLADHPNQDDRELFRRFLTADVSAVDQTIASLRGLAAVGKSDDCTSIKGLLLAGSPVIKAAAARAFLALATDKQHAIRDLLADRSASVVWIIVADCLQRQRSGAWDILKELLTDTDDDIRRLVCHFAVKTMNRQTIHKVLSEYLKQRYYYNVVVLFDRALYAPSTARRYFAQQELEYFYRLSNEATRNWPGLNL